MRVKKCNNYVKCFRVASNFSQTDLAEMCGTSQNTISAIENGQVPSVVLALRIAKVLNVPVTALWLDFEEV